MIFGCLAKLIVQQEELKHSPEPFQFRPLQPRKGVSAKRKFRPFIQGLRFPYSHLSKLSPDGNTGIRSENIWGTTHVPKLARDIAHGAQSFHAIRFGFARVSKD